MAIVRDADPRTGPAVLIRPAVPEDDGVLADLDRRCWSWLSDVGPQRPKGEPFFDAAHGPEQFLVATAADRVIGYVRIVPPTRLRSNAHVRQIQGLSVDRETRGLGIGRALVEAACAEARRQGARRLTLRVLAHNAPARRLYERCGFVVEGVLREEFLLDGRFVDDIWMARRVDG
jgi:ribosomal protein S18 acetylase RimI-like enzyme